MGPDLLSRPRRAGSVVLIYPDVERMDVDRTGKGVDGDMSIRMECSFCSFDGSSMVYRLIPLPKPLANPSMRGTLTLTHAF